MRRPVKPFAVEVRRAGRRVPQSFIPAREIEEAPQPDYFTSPAEASPSPAPAQSAEQAPPRRVLQDLNEQRHDPLAERLQELASRLARRGRPPGSTNKTQRARARVDLSEFFDTQEAQAPVALTSVPYKPRPREQRFSWVKKKLLRGERWKRRLLKILW